MEKSFVVVERNTSSGTLYLTENWRQFVKDKKAAFRHTKEDAEEFIRQHQPAGRLWEIEEA